MASSSNSKSSVPSSVTGMPGSNVIVEPHWSSSNTTRSVPAGSIDIVSWTRIGMSPIGSLDADHPTAVRVGSRAQSRIVSSV